VTGAARESVPVLVLGAGPAGLSAAYHLGLDHLVLEKDSRPGGLCRSFTMAGAVFDLGGHAFFTKHEEVEALYRRSVGEVYRQPRQAVVHSHGTVVPYPFQSNLYGLPVEVVRDCLVELFEARGHEGRPVENLSDWVLGTFGAGIARHFMLPYNAKVWAHPLDQVNPVWTGHRVVLPDVTEIVDGALRRRDFTRFPNAVVGYPAEGGYERFLDEMAAAAGERLLVGEAAVAVELDRHLLTTSRGRTIHYEHLVSTIPLPDLVACSDPVPAEVAAAAAELHSNGLLLVNLVFDRPGRQSWQRVYVADPAVPFHKLVLNSNSSESLRRGPFAVQAEVSFSAHKPVEVRGLERRVLAAVRDLGVLDESAQLLATSVVTVPRAYPISTRASGPARDQLLAYYRAHDVHCCGRFGAWQYINSDDAVLAGRDAVRPLGGGDR
jgi:UDP-galactopyranose mutase